jgi:hypothetical protein
VRDNIGEQSILAVGANMNGTVDEVPLEKLLEQPTREPSRTAPSEIVIVVYLGSERVKIASNIRVQG